MSHALNPLAARRLGTRCLAVTLILLTCATVRALAAEKQAPGAEAFWLRAPAQGPFTVALFDFDGNASADDAIGSLEEALLVEDDDADLPSLGASDAPEAETTLSGGAKLVERGRWKGGLEVGSAGSARLAPLPLTKLVDSDITIDLWLRPDADQPNEGVVLALRDDLSGLYVTRSGDGRLSLHRGDRVLIAHKRVVPADTWTHIALRCGRDRDGRTLALLVEGNEEFATLSGNVPGVALVGAAVTLGAVEKRQSVSGLYDAVHVRRTQVAFYPVLHEPFIDTAAQRVLADQPPYFARRLIPTLSLAFDGSLEPRSFAGTGWHDDDSGARFTPGMRGEALIASSIDPTLVSYRGVRALSPRQGTLEVWVQPRSWDNFFVGDFLGTNVPSMTVLSQGKDDEGRRQRGGLKVRLGRSGQNGKAAFEPLHPGRWTQLVVVWDNFRTRGVYLNGEPQPLYQFGMDLGGSVVAAAKSGAADDAITLRFERTGTLFDELSIYDRPLNAMEVRNLHARYYPDAESRLAVLPLIAPSFTYQHYDTRLFVRVSCLPVNEVDPTHFRVTLFDAAGKARFESELTPLKPDGTGGVMVDQAFDFGKHNYVITTHDADGKQLARIEKVWHREQPIWWQNDLGVTRNVPKPWSPIEVDGSDIRVWGRTIRLDDTGLPASISAVGDELLAAAVSMTGSVDGEAVTFRGEGVTWTETAGDVSRWRASTTGGSVEADIAASIEFDGLMQYAVTLRPAGDKPVTIDTLTVDVPMTASNAFQLIANGGGSNFRASYDVRMVPDGEGRVWDSMRSKPRMQRSVQRGSFLPLIWLGGDDRGLCFTGENDKGWTPNPKEAAQEVHRQGDTIVYRMNIISMPVTIDGDRTFTFVLLPTPTKPLAKNWRTFGRTLTYDTVDDFSGMPMTEPADGPGTSISFRLEPITWDDAAVWRQRLRDKFPEPAPILKYIDASWPKLGPSTQEFRYSLWAGAGRMTWTREIEDYYVWIMHEYLKRGLIEGLYIDDVSMPRSMALYATAYRLPDGTVQPGFNTLGLRRFLKRMWVLFQQYDTQPHIVPHMTWCFELPAFSFVEAGLNGEDRVIPPYSNPTFIDKWRQDEIRIMSGGEKFGFVTLWIPEIKTEGHPKEKIEGWAYGQARAMHALAVQHDLWYMFHWPSGNVVGRDMIAFGADKADTRFIGQWDAAPHMELSGKRTQACFYVRDNRALVMISNYAREEQTVTLKVDAAGLLELSKAGKVTWVHADSTFEPPVTNTASKAELKQAERGLKDISLDGELDDALGMDFALDDPELKRREKYAIKPNGNSVTVVVRPHDYRLLEMRVEE